MGWTLSDFSMLAEIIGTLSIIGSLIFVGFQIAESNREARAATLQAAMNLEITTAVTFADHADTWNNVMIGAPLNSGEETRRALVLYNISMVESESKFHQFEAGYLDRSSWEARRSVLPLLVNLPVFTTWRNSPGGLSHTQEFLKILDAMVTKDPS